MLRQEAIEVLAEARGDAISVATMQSIPPWHDAEQAAKDHIDAVGCMGSASGLGLGLALAQPGRQVVVLDGDGSLLMQLGALVTVAEAAPANFYHFVFENGHYETSGNQTIPAGGRVDFCQLALGAGYAKAVSFDDAEALRAALPGLLKERGPVLIRLVIAREDKPVRFPALKMAEQAQALRASLTPSA